MHNYKISSFISEGRFGRVTKAVHIPTNDLVAIKEVFYRNSSRRVNSGGQVIVEEVDAWTRSIQRELATLKNKKAADKVVLQDQVSSENASESICFDKIQSIPYCDSSMLELQTYHNENSNFQESATKSTNISDESTVDYLTHPNIIQLLDHFRSDTMPCYCLVYEFCDYDLGRIDFSKFPLNTMNTSESEESKNFKSNIDRTTFVRKIIRQLLNGIVELHSVRKVMHRDLKPSNLLLTREGIVKIADFGSARSLKQKVETAKFSEKLIQSDSMPVKLKEAQVEPNTNCSATQQQSTVHFPSLSDCTSIFQKDSVTGNSDSDELTREICTRWYKSIEQLFGSYNYDEKVDIWALGCIVYEFLNAEPIFDGHCDVDQIGKIYHRLGSVSLEEWPEAKRLPDWNKIEFTQVSQPPNQYYETQGFSEDSLIAQCLCLNPRNRSSAEDLCQHAWFQNENKHCQLNDSNDNFNTNFEDSDLRIDVAGLELEKMFKATAAATSAAAADSSDHNDHENLKLKDSDHNHDLSFGEDHSDEEIPLDFDENSSVIRFDD